MRTISRLFATTVLVLSFASMQAAQGPAGAGAGDAAGGGTSSHSYNPMKWIGKKDDKPTADTPFANDEAEKRLEAKLRAMQVLSETATLKESCVNFVQRVDCLAALHVSHNVGL